MATASEDEIAAGPVGHPSRKMLGCTGAAKVARDPGGGEQPRWRCPPLPPTPRSELFPMDIGRLRYREATSADVQAMAGARAPDIEAGPDEIERIPTNT